MLNTYLAIANSPLLWVFLTMVVAAFGIMKVTTLEVKPKHYDAGWLRKNYVGLLIAVATLLAVSAVYFYLFGIGVSLNGIVARLRMAASDGNTAPEDLRHLGTTVALLMGVLAAAATIFFSIIRVWINERTATATEEGLITDRISKAVEGLGAEKTVKFEGEESTAPNLEVRIGAIYALERIAQDSLRDHIQIMEILCAYIRENAPERDAENLPKLTQKQHSGPRSDIQVALQVIGRRPSAQKIKERTTKTAGSNVGYRLDLRNSNLQLVDIVGLDFSHALFSGSNAFGASMEGTDLRGAGLERTNLGNADLYAAKLQGASFWKAEFDHYTELGKASFKGAIIKDASLRTTLISEEQMNECYGDASVTGPKGLAPGMGGWPPRWSTANLELHEAHTQWRAFQASIGQDPDNPM